MAAGGSELTWQTAAARWRHDLSDAAAARAARTPAGAADGDARGRALQPHGSHPRQGHAGQGRAERPDEVPRRDHAERLQRHRGDCPAVDPVLKDEVVMLGAHFDSVAAGTGATDNATGSAAMMEAMRILKAVGVKPRRTIRIGAVGRRRRRAARFARLRARASRRRDDDGVEAGACEAVGVLQFRQRHRPHPRHLAAGQPRGRADLPAVDRAAQGSRRIALGPRSVISTDHVSFDAAGLPAFQFMVERLEYNSRTHHSNMDTFDRVQARRHGAARDGDRRLRLQRGDAR